jgi:DNA-binding MarR family transcriptional regulator
MEDRLNQYFNSLRNFSNLFIHKLITNGNEADCELKLSQMKALSSFKGDQPFQMKELAQNCGVKLSNMTIMIDDLIEEGFAERKRDESDRRKVLVTLTSKGQNLRAKFMESRRKTATSIFSKLSEKDKSDLLNSLDRVCTILEKTISSDEPD